jgi:hypothetical protein
MCRLSDVFSVNDLKGLSKESRAILQEYGRLLALTDPAIRNIIKRSPEVRKKLNSLLTPELRALKRKEG